MWSCGAENSVSAAPWRCRGSSSFEAYTRTRSELAPSQPGILRRTGQELATRADPQLLENVPNVRGRCREARPKLDCDGLVRKAPLHQRHDFPLSRCELAVVVGREAHEGAAVPVVLLA